MRSTLALAPATLPTDVAYAVDGYRGIAFSLAGHPMTEPQETYEIDCESDDCPHDMPWCWTDTTPEPEADTDRAVVVMIGDDRQHIVDVSDLTPLTEDDYCAGCGQTGCGH